MSIKIETNPVQIEKDSFAMITEILGDRKLDAENELVIKRVIHTSADFDYVENLVFTPGVSDLIRSAFSQGAHIVTDTTMCQAGINKKKLGAYGGQVHCFVHDEDVAEEAKKRGVTRAIVSMEKAARLQEKIVFAIGNAPTALLKICEMIEKGQLSPVAVIGAPVGFVNVVESKEVLVETAVPSITARGRKGGSNVAAAICNALLYSIQA